MMMTVMMAAAVVELAMTKMAMMMMRTKIIIRGIVTIKLIKMDTDSGEK